MRLWQTAAAEGRPNQIVNVEESFAGPSVGEVLTLAFSHGGSALPRWPRCSQRTGSGPSKLQNCKWKTRNFAHSTVLVLRMAHRNWKETKQQPSMLPVPAVLGCCLVSFHFLWAILSTSTVRIFITFQNYLPQPSNRLTFTLEGHIVGL